MTKTERRTIPLSQIYVIREYQLAGTDSAEPLETKCLNSVSRAAVAVQMDRVGSTEIILQSLMVLLTGRCVLTCSLAAVTSQRTSMSATAQGSTFTEFSHRFYATYVIVAMEYQVRLGLRLILITKLNLYFICILMNIPLIHGYCNERKAAIY